MKKIFLTIILCSSLILCTGCFGKQNRTIDSSTDTIPENGIVESSALKRLQSDNLIAVMHGESDGIKYEWTIFGSDIKKPRDIDLAVSFEGSGEDEEIIVNLDSEESFGFVPMLSVHLNEKWNSKSAVVYSFSNDEIVPVCSASLTGSENTVLNFSVPNTYGEYIIRGEGSNGGFIGVTNQDSLGGTPEEGKTKIENPEQMTCTFSIECTSVLNHIHDLDEAKLDVLPSDGIILEPVTVEFSEGDSVFDILQSYCRVHKIHMESMNTPIYGSAYVEGIGNLCETDCGSLSGWVYRVNGWYPNYGCGRYIPENGDVIEWRYTCDLGKDVGCEAFEQR